MQDGFGRQITYLRLSVTDLCNYRCLYCMPERGICKRAHEEILSVEECVRVARAAAACGVRKVRVTGGEPLVRRGILDILSGIAEIPGIDELCLTTNGALLGPMAADLKRAGVSRLNISLDTLNPARFHELTRRGDGRDVRDGIAAAEAAGFTDLKLNVVLLGGFNEDEIADFVGLTREHVWQVRFIELMPIGQCAGWDHHWFLPAETVLERCPDLRGAGETGVARLYRVPGWKGSVGLITPLSHRFCGGCDRIRVTADGRLKPCLHADTEILLKGLNDAELLARLREGIAAKPSRHHLESGASESRRNMNQIGG